MNIAFVGTPDFSARVLTHLVAVGRRPDLLISQPDRPCGRGRKMSRPPAVVEAVRLGVKFLQVEDINDAAVVDSLRAADIATLVVASFGQILAPSLLNSFLCVNVHASLLPAYRGAAPIERAIAAGEPRIGISIMQMTPELDGGPIALQTSVSVGLRDDAGSIGHVLAVLGAVGVDQVLRGLSDRTVSWREQEGRSTYAAKLSAVDAVLDPAKEALAVHDQVRSLSPSIGARASNGGLLFKVWRTWPYGQLGLDPLPEQGREVAGLPGLVCAQGGRLFVGCAQGAIELLVVQPAGKGEMTASSFLRGYGSRLNRCLDSIGGAETDSQTRTQ